VTPVSFTRRNVTLLPALAVATTAAGQIPTAASAPADTAYSAGVSSDSVDHPDRYPRHSGFVLRIDTLTSATYQDGAFRVV
jgi:hypothetical protein